MYVKPLIVMGLVATLGLTGCSYFHPYRPDIEQGNVMSQDRVAQLKVGMSRQKVTEIIGDTRTQFHIAHQSSPIYLYLFSKLRRLPILACHAYLPKWPRHAY